MEHGVYKMKIVLAGVLASLMLFAAAMPAVAQADAQGGDVQIQNQYCPQIINQYANADQSNTGGGIAAAIAQDLGINQSAVNACIQAGGDINIGGATPDTTTSQTTTPGGTTPDRTTSDTPDSDPGAATLAEVNGEKIVLSADLPKVLANTGGFAPSAASMLLPAGALLVVSGAMTFWLGTRRR